MPSYLIYSWLGTLSGLLWQNSCETESAIVFVGYVRIECSDFGRRDKALATVC